MRIFHLDYIYQIVDLIFSVLVVSRLQSNGDVSAGIRAKWHRSMRKVRLHTQYRQECPMQNSVTNCGYLMVIKHSQQLELKRNHEYYYQLMGQMGVTGCAWYD